MTDEVVVLSSTGQMQDYYSILGIESDDGVDEIKRAYRAKARQLHPDKGGNHDEMKLLNEAYEVLTDPEARNAYDREFAAPYSGRSAWQPRVEANSDSAPALRQPHEVRWLISRAIVSFLLGLYCFAESGNPILIGHSLYEWLLRGLAMLFLLLGALMLYTVHRFNRMRAEVASPERAHINIYRFVFVISISSLVILLTVLSLVL